MNKLLITAPTTFKILRSNYFLRLLRDFRLKGQKYQLLGANAMLLQGLNRNIIVSVEYDYVTLRVVASRLSVSFPHFNSISEYYAKFEKRGFSNKTFLLSTLCKIDRGTVIY